jgi:hypothetical protein
MTRDEVLASVLRRSDALSSGDPDMSPCFTMRITQTWIRSADGWQCLAEHAGPLGT